MKPATFRWNLAALSAIQPDPPSQQGEYAGFSQIDGNHPWKFAVPNGYIEYQARILRGTKVVYFNFSLAKEMGLIPGNHKHKITPELEKEIISTFALRIINEYDQLSGTRFPSRDIKQNRYMATRYLQLQHNCKRGGTSGDGRSIWNGQFVSKDGVAWDISSCGTGVTCLSPGFALEGRPIRSGDPKVSYGSGLADVDEGLTAAILSESFHRRGLLTERTLAILESPEGRGINVRAARNLLRPSHLFLHLKQGNQLMLKRALDFYLTKQTHNGDWSPPREGDKYDHLLLHLARQYGNFSARLEDEYIFCWLDWDGDNMLLDGGIIDYGSIRQFGICHHRYRYDDVDRFSTSLREQKNKARYLVQTCIQMVDFVRSGEKRHLRQFAQSYILKEFDQAYENALKDCLLKRVGLNKSQRQRCLENSDLVAEFMRAYRFFESRESPRGLRKVPDGINNPAIFCTRTMLRELPRLLLLNGRELSADEFVKLLKTPFLTKKEERSSNYSLPAVRFQRLYLEVLRLAHPGKPFRRVLLETAMRASQSNHTGYATGDGIIHVVDFLLEKRKKIPRNEFQNLIESFIRVQQGLQLQGRLRKQTRRMLEKILALVAENRFSI